MGEVKRKVLVSDDEDFICQLCSRVLKAQDCEVTVVQSGDAAMKTLAGTEFDLVLTDITMPGSVDGVRLCEEIK